MHCYVRRCPRTLTTLNGKRNQQRQNGGEGRQYEQVIFSVHERVCDDQRSTTVTFKKKSHLFEKITASFSKPRFTF